MSRFNPPTIGHEKLLDRVARVSANEMRIYISMSNDPQKNPLNPRLKLDYMKKIFPRYARKIMLPRTNIVIDIITDLYKEGFTDLIMQLWVVIEYKNLKHYLQDTMMSRADTVIITLKVLISYQHERDPDAEGASYEYVSK